MNGFDWMRFHNITATKSRTRDDFENKSSQIIQEKNEIYIKL
jgi:hypothetical protein